jgi:hypothetical protein
MHRFWKPTQGEIVGLLSRDTSNMLGASAFFIRISLMRLFFMLRFDVPVK